MNVVDELVPIIRSKCRSRDESDFPAFGSNLGDLGFLDVLHPLEREGEHRWTDERAVAADLHDQMPTNAPHLFFRP